MYSSQDPSAAEKKQNLSIHLLVREDSMTCLSKKRKS